MEEIIKMLPRYRVPVVKKTNRRKKTHEEYVAEVAVKNPNIEVVGRYIDANTVQITATFSRNPERLQYVNSDDQTVTRIISANKSLTLTPTVIKGKKFVSPLNGVEYELPPRMGVMVKVGAGFKAYISNNKKKMPQPAMPGSPSRTMYSWAISWATCTGATRTVPPSGPGS